MNFDFNPNSNNKKVLSDPFSINAIKKSSNFNLNLKDEKLEEFEEKKIIKQKLFSNEVIKNQILKNSSNHTDGIICKACLWTFTKFHKFLHKKYGLTLLNEVLGLLCSVAVEYRVCRNAIYLYSPEIYDSLLEHYLDAEFICTKTRLCKVSHYIELDPDDYARTLLKDKPETAILIPNEKAKKLKFLHVTDIHTDLLYKEVIKYIFDI